MSVASDYADRQIDLSVLQWTRASGELLLRQRLAVNGGGRQVAGVLRLAQRFLLSLLTPRGSVRHYPSRGSTFLVELRAQRVRTASDLLGAASRGLVDVRRELAADERDTDPLDERFGGASVTRVELNSGTARVWFDLRSRDPSARIIMPVDLSLVPH